MSPLISPPVGSAVGGHGGILRASADRLRALEHSTQHRTPNANSHKQATSSTASPRLSRWQPPARSCQSPPVAAASSGNPPRTCHLEGFQRGNKLAHGKAVEREERNRCITDPLGTRHPSPHPAARRLPAIYTSHPNCAQASHPPSSSSSPRASRSYRAALRSSAARESANRSEAVCSAAGGE